MEQVTYHVQNVGVQEASGNYQDDCDDNGDDIRVRGNSSDKTRNQLGYAIGYHYAGEDKGKGKNHIYNIVIRHNIYVGL